MYGSNLGLFIILQFCFCYSSTGGSGVLSCELVRRAAKASSELMIGLFFIVMFELPGV